MFDNVTINASDDLFEQTDFGDCPFNLDFVPPPFLGKNFNAPTVNIKAKVKKKYEGLFKEIKVALEVINMIRYRYENNYGCYGIYHDLLNSIDLNNNCINYSMFVNQLLFERRIEETHLVEVINMTKMSGKLREKYKSVLNCHESSENTFGNVFDILSDIDNLAVCERKDALFLTISVAINYLKNDSSVSIGLLIETFCEKVISIDADVYNVNIKNYRTEEGEWNNKLIIDYTKDNKDKQLIIPLLDLNKIYNVKLRAVFKEEIQKNMGAVLEVFKFSLSKKDISTDCRLRETIRTFSVNNDMVLNYIIDMVYDTYPVDLEDFTADDMADINKILASKGYGQLLTHDEYYDKIDSNFNFEGTIEYVSEELSEKQWDLEINVRGDLITKLIDSFEKMRHNTIELSCIVDGKEVLQ